MSSGYPEPECIPMLLDLCSPSLARFNDNLHFCFTAEVSKVDMVAYKGLKSNEHRVNQTFYELEKEDIIVMQTL